MMLLTTEKKIKMKILKIIKYSICLFIGHSNIIEGDFGWMHCARCGWYLGDSLGGAYSNDKCVIVGHSCKICKKNWKKLTWKDKLLAPSYRDCFQSTPVSNKETKE